MADASREQFSKSKNNRKTRKKEKRKERKLNSHHTDYQRENDSKHQFRTNHEKDSAHQDPKHISYDRNRKDEERKIHFTQPQDDRYISYRSGERNHYSTPSYRHGEGIDESFGNSSTNNERYSNKYGGNTHDRSFNEARYDNRRANDERFVTFNRSGSTNSDECVGSLWQKVDYLSNQVDVLTQENERLKYFLNMRNNAHENPLSEVTITFRNKDLEERFLPILTELASDLIQDHITVDELRNIKYSKNKSPEIIEDIPEGELFQLDNSTAEPDENPHVPKYETSFSEVLEDEDGKIKLDEKSAKPRFQKVCYNCGEDHVISKCPHKINYFKVANAKRQQQQQRGPPPTVRYHLNKDYSESGFKPGVLSSELREALGLKSNQIPPFIYRMRLINYPPGWLQDAMVESSGIAVYDSNGPEQRNEENAESVMNRPEIRFDPDKFIDFPGFNVPLPPDYVDESYELGYPPIQGHHMRSYVEQNMPKAEIRPNRKRKLQIKIESSSKIQRLEEDMDLDEDLGDTFFQFTPPLPQDAPPPPPPEDAPEPPPDEDTPESPPVDDTPESPPEELVEVVTLDDSDSGTDTPMSDSIMEALAPVVERFKMEHSDSAEAHSSSPSLKELEEIKTRLLMQLGNVSNCPSPSVQDGSQADAEDLNPNSDSRGSLPCQDSSNDLSNLSNCSFGSNLAEIGQSSSSLKRSQSVCSKSKMMTLGTPSLSRHSSYQKLPDYDKFAENVTSHINFENLPNSVGTYEKMKKVLKKVKEKFNALMP